MSMNSSSIRRATPASYAIVFVLALVALGPILVMLTALIFRGVAFEFRAHGRKSGRARRPNTRGG